MGKIGLKIKANLTNVDKLYPLHPEQFGWALKVKCTGCGEENPNWHLISQEDEYEQINSHVNFLYKCKCCSRENSVSIVPISQLSSNKKTSSKNNMTTEYLEGDDNKFKMIVSFDCRGLELIDYEPRDGWAVLSKKKLFDDVDLSGKDWCDYNDLDNEPVEVTNFEFQFESLK